MHQRRSLWMSRKSMVTAAAAALAVAVACSRQSAPPVAPSGTGNASAAVPADGSTLKVSAPTLLSPLNDQQQSDSPTLAASAASVKFGATLPSPLTYRFQVIANGSQIVADSGPTGSLTYRVTSTLAFKTRYTWRVRAEVGNDAGPWSASGSFVSSEGGYIRGNEVFDPLSNGATVGQAVGPVSFSG